MSGSVELVVPVKDLASNQHYIQLFGNDPSRVDITKAVAKRDWNATIELLAFLRETKQRRSDIVFALGKNLLQNKASSLGKDVWVVYEQVATSAIDLGEDAVAIEYIKKLEARFPRSFRVKHLRGLLLESQSRWEDADALYVKLLKIDPADIYSIKRRIAILKSTGKINAAIQAMNKYLEDFQADDSAWHELSDLYISQLAFKQATFCFEELILAAPANYQFYARYAELLYSVGNTNRARDYFCYSLKLNISNNLRSLYGVLLCCNANDHGKLYVWASEKLQKIYEQNKTKTSTYALKFIKK